MSLPEILKTRFPQYVIATQAFRGDETIVLKREGLLEVAKALKEDPVFDFNFLMDLTCVDYLKFGTFPYNAPTTATPSPLPFFMKPKIDPRGESWERPEGAVFRFEVVYHFYSLSKNHRLRVKVGVDDKSPEVNSVTSIWAAADWFEREVWDMFGIVFKDHPNLKRILMYKEFVGHPLRKDYPVNKRQPLIGPIN